MNLLGNISIKWKQTVLVTFVTTIALVLACIGFFTSEITNVRKEMVSHLSTLGEIVANNSTAGLEFSDQNSVEDTLSALRAEKHIIGAAVYSKDGQVFATYDRAADTHSFVAPPLRTPGWQFTNRSLDIFRPIQHNGESLGTVYVQSDLDALSARLHRYIPIAAALFSASIALAFVLSTWLQRMISDPIFHLVTTARNIAQQKNYSLRARARGKDELGMLVDSFNEMLSQIQARDAELEKARVVLEQRVYERTAELAGANAALRQENTVRESAEFRLRQMEETYRRAIAGADAVPYSYDYTSRTYLFMGEGIASLIGYTAQEITPELWQEIIQESVMLGETTGLAKHDAAERVKTGELRSWRCDMRVRTKDGQIRWISDASVQTFDDEGKARGSMGILQDITERKLAEEEREKFFALIENSSDFIGIMDLDANPIYMNRAGRRLIGFENEDIRLLDPVGHLGPEACEQKIKVILPQVRSTGSWEGETHVRHLVTGTRIDVHRHTFLVTHPRTGKPLCIASIIRDITERKKAEDSLRLLSSAIEQSAHNVCITDIRGRIEYANPAFMRLTGYTRDELTGQSARILKSGRQPADFYQKLWSTILAGNSFRGEFINRKKDGEVFYEEKIITPVRDSAGQIVHFVASGRDITERKNAEAELEALNRQLLDVSRRAGMAEVATGVLHNVGNVLNSVNVTATLVEEQLRNSCIGDVTRVAELVASQNGSLARFLTEDPRGQKVPQFLSQLAARLSQEQESAMKELDGLRRNIEHIKEIVAMQQSYARVSGLNETLLIADVVEDSIRMNAAALARHGIHVRREFQDVPPITTDRHKVLQILVNLIRNAKYACDESAKPEKQIAVSIAHGDDDVKITVQDNGIGIPPENLTRIFNHGFTTRKNGHGFGLHSGANAAKELGGSLTVHSDGPGQGAAFTLRLKCEHISSSI